MKVTDQELRNWSVLAARALDDSWRVLDTIEYESSDEQERLCALMTTINELFTQALTLHGLMTRRELDSVSPAPKDQT